MNWKIELNGNKNYLENLSFISEKLNINPKVYKEKEGYFLEGSIFETSNNVKEILEKAKLYLTIISSASVFKSSDTLDLTKVENITWVSEDNKFRKIYDKDGNLYLEEKINDDGSVQRVYHLNAKSSEFKFTFSKAQVLIGNELPNFESLNETKYYMEENANDSVKLEKIKKIIFSKVDSIKYFVENFYSDFKVKEINELITTINAVKNLMTRIKNQPEVIKGLEIAEWASLYRIYEIVEKDIKDKAKEWLKGEQWETFCRNADYYHRHSAKRLFNLVQPPKRIMPLSEAEELISTLLSKYIEEKSKEK